MNCPKTIVFFYIIIDTSIHVRIKMVQINARIYKLLLKMYFYTLMSNDKYNTYTLLLQLTG